MPPIATRVLALLFALSWLFFPGFGLIDLSVTWSPDWPVMLEAGWGLFFSVFVGLAFLMVALFPKRSGAAVAQLYVATVALTVASAVSLEWRALVLAAAVAVETAVVTRVREAESLRPVVMALSRSLLMLAAAAALWPSGRRLLGTCAGVVALYLGIVTFAWPGTPGGFSQIWSAFAAAWGACFIVLAWMQAPGIPRSERVEDTYGAH